MLCSINECVRLENVVQIVKEARTQLTRFMRAIMFFMADGGAVDWEWSQWFHLKKSWARVQSSAFSVQPHLPVLGWLLGVATGGAIRVDWDHYCQLWEVQTGQKWVKIWQKMEWNGQIIGRIEENLKLPPVYLRWLLLKTEMWSDTRGWFSGGDARKYLSNTKLNNNMEKWVWCSTSISTNVIYFLSNMIRKIYYLK